MAKKKSSSKKTSSKKTSSKKTSSKTFYAGKILVVVEAPGKVSKIQGYLGPDYVVRASVGHIMDLPQKSLGVDVDNKYTPTYEVMPGKKDVVDEVKAISKQVSTAYIATDEDREGEFIGYSVAMQIKRPGLTIKRIKFNSITKAAIQKAVQNPISLDKHLVRAQQGRRILDRLVGFKVSPLLWSSIRKGLSAGRVQSVGLRIIVDRQFEIDAFVPKDYWTIKVQLTTVNGDTFEAEVPKKYDKEADAKADVKKITGNPYIVAKVDKKQATKKPPPAFTTSAMVQQANTTLGWSAKRTNAAAQKLYEAGSLTYIRTDSIVMDPAAVTSIRTYLQSVGASYLPKTAPKYKNKANAQEAHEAIRPTDVTIASLAGQAPPDQVKLYELIYKRAIASQSTPAQFDRVTVTIENSGVKLVAKGQTLKFDGYLKFWTYSDTKEVLLPQLKTQDKLQGKNEKAHKHTTKPPAKYNTASIIKKLEETGVGRPSTYQSIIETLLNRQYIIMDGKAFVPTEIGKEVCVTLKDFIPRVVDVDFTAQMEEKLDEVAGGNLEWTDAIDLFWSKFEQEIEKAGKDLAERANKTDYTCDKCGAPLVRRVSSGGPFYACTNIDPAKAKSKKAIINNIKGKPFCGAIYQIGDNGEPIEKKVETYNQPCKTCGAPMVKKTARKGGGVAFWGCSNYNLTGCKTTCSMDGQWKIPSASVVVGTCDKCKKGNMIVKDSRRGKFVACDRYPKCKNAKNLKEFGLDKDGNPLPTQQSK